MGEKRECPIDKEARKVKPLDLESVAGVFIVVACAIGIGLLALLLELIYSRCRRKEVRTSCVKQNENGLSLKQEAIQKSNAVWI